MILSAKAGAAPGRPEAKAALVSAMELADRAELGLGAALRTADLARRIDQGALHIRGLTAPDARPPIGGLPRPGQVRGLGSHGLKELTNLKTLRIGPARAPARVEATD